MMSTVSGTDLKSGFVAMSDLLGTRSATKLLEYFETAGISFDKENSYSFEQIERALGLVFGEPVGLVVEDLKKRLTASQE